MATRAPRLIPVPTTDRQYRFAYEHLRKASKAPRVAEIHYDPQADTYAGRCYQAKPFKAPPGTPGRAFGVWCIDAEHGHPQVHFTSWDGYRRWRSRVALLGANTVTAGVASPCAKN